MKFEYIFRKAEEKDIDELEIIQILGIDELKKKGNYIWRKNIYPTKQTIIDDINRKELYVMKSNDMIIGYMVITTTDYPKYEYSLTNWKGKTNFAVFRRFTMNTKISNRIEWADLLQTLMEKEAVLMGFQSLRLETLSNICNKNVWNFLEKHGFKKIDEVFYKEKNIHCFHYEKILKKPNL